MSRALVLCLILAAVPVAARPLRARLARPQRGVQVRTSSFTVAAAHEREICQLVTLPNAQPMDVDAITVVTPTAPSAESHHFAIFLWTGGDPAAVPTAPFDAPGCIAGFVPGVEPILGFVQTSRQRLRFPAGVGVRLAAHQRLLLNSHFINGSAENLAPEVAVNFHAARRGSIRHHARSFQLGALDISVPPHGTGVAGGTFVTPFAMNVVQLVPHSHKHTTQATIDVVRGGAPGETLVTSTDYAHPVHVEYAPPLRLEPGDGLRWQCDYRNDTDQTVHFGVTSNDEMCFATGFFYQDDDAAPVPTPPHCLPQTDALLCFP